MRLMSLAFLTLMAITLPSFLLAGGAIYVCTPGQGVHYTYSADDQSWRPEIGSEGDIGFMINKTVKRWYVQLNDRPEKTNFKCEVSIANKDVIYCTHESNMVLIEFNESNLRYTLAFVTGYSFDWYMKEGKVSPGMEIGTCIATNS